MHGRRYAALPGSRRTLVPLLAISMVGLLGQPAAAQQSQAFYCINDVYNPPIQPFVVPQRISELQVLVQGAHGGTPEGDGGKGGIGGSVQATFAVTPQGPLKPGRALEVWVGCHSGE